MAATVVGLLSHLDRVGASGPPPHNVLAIDGGILINWPNYRLQMQVNGSPSSCKSHIHAGIVDGGPQVDASLDDDLSEALQGTHHRGQSPGTATGQRGYRHAGFPPFLVLQISANVLQAAWFAQREPACRRASALIFRCL